MKWSRRTPVGMSWSQLNAALMETEDEGKLAAWLKEMLDGASMSMSRALRIHGRLNGVRRAREIKEIRERVAAKRKKAA